MSLLDTKIDNKLLSQLKTQKTKLLEQIKTIKFQERELIEKVLKKCIPLFVSLSWYDSEPNYFNLSIEGFNISQILELHKELEDWDISFDAYTSDYIQIRFNRIEKD